MVFERYSELEGEHAFLSPSQPHWLRYTDEKLVERFVNAPMRMSARYPTATVCSPAARVLTAAAIRWDA